jgi:hypothetical protein
MPLIQIDSEKPTPIWSIVASDPTAQILLVNTDISANISIGNAAVQIGGNDSSVIPPQSSLSLPANQSWYALSDQANDPILQVTLGGGNWSTSPIQAAEAMLEAGIATDIAEAIFAIGIPQVAAPITLYDINGTGGAGGDVGLVGATIPQSALLGTGCTDSYVPPGTSQDAADTAFVNIVGRGNGTHLTVTKKFWNLSDWSQTKNNMANYFAHGTKVVVCVKPLFTPGLALGSNFTTTGTTAQKNAAIAELAKLNTFLAWLTGLGFNATNCEMVCWQEPANSQNFGHGGGADFNNMLRTYGSAITAAGFPLCVNVNYDANVANATNFLNAALGLRAFSGAGAVGLPVVTSFALDLYTNNAIGNNLLPTTVDSNGDSFDNMAAAHGMIVSLNEIGCNPDSHSPPSALHFSLADCTTYFNDMTSYGQGVLQAGRQLGQMIYYCGICSASGIGDITSPIGFDPLVPHPPDFRVALYQTMTDTLTANTANPVTIPATHTTTLVPVSPSPSGGLADSQTLSYEIAFGLSAGASSTNPFAIVTLKWFDFDQVARTQTAVDQIEFAVPMGVNGDPNGPLVVFGGGRMRGAFMTVSVNNQDSVPCSIGFFQITGTSRPGRRDSWIWDPNANQSPLVPTFTLASAAAKSLQIGREQNINVLAGASKSFLNGLWAGQAFIRILVSGAAANGDVHIQLQPQPAGQFGTEDILNESMGLAGGGNDERVFTIALVRAPTLLVMNNNDANAVTVSYQIIAIETA